MTRRLWRGVVVAVVVIGGGMAPHCSVAQDKPGNELSITFRLLGEEYCRISEGMQSLQLRGKLNIKNISGETVRIQKIARTDEVRIARTLGEAKTGPYEMVIKGDDVGDLDPRATPFSPITLKAGEMVQTPRTINVPVGLIFRPEETVGPGRHYLLLKIFITIGSDDPQKWRTVQVRATPITINVSVPNSAACVDQK